MRKTAKELSIDGVNFMIHPFSPDTGLKVLARLLKTFAVPMAQLADANLADTASFLPKMLSSLSERMDEDVVVALVKDIVATVEVGGVPVSSNYASVFTGRLGTLLKLALEVVRFNFEDFFAASVSAGRAQLAKVGAGA